MLRFLLLGCLVGCASLGWTQWFDNEAMFAQSLTGPYYHEGFDNFTQGTLNGQTSWESPYVNSYKFQMYGGGVSQGLLSRPGEVTTFRPNLSSANAPISTTFHVGTSPLVHAFGVRLKCITTAGTAISGTVKLSVYQDGGGSSPLEYVAQVGEAGVFIGLHSTASLDQAGMFSLSGANTKVVVDDIYLGQPVPEISPAYALGAGLFGLIRVSRRGQIGAKRRRKPGETG